MHNVVADTGAQLPGLQEYRLRPSIRTMDPWHKPRRAPATGPRRAVADFGDAQRQRRHALRGGLRRVRAGADGLTSVIPMPGRGPLYRATTPRLRTFVAIGSALALR